MKKFLVLFVILFFPCIVNASTNKSFSVETNNITLTKNEINTFNLKSSSLIGATSDELCKSYLGSPEEDNTPAYYLVIAFSIIKYVAIILLLVLTVMDFLTATASQDSDIMKKTMSKTIKRLILCALIFVLPTIISYILTIINDQQLSTCITRIMFRI